MLGLARMVITYYHMYQKPTVLQYFDKNIVKIFVSGIDFTIYGILSFIMKLRRRLYNSTLSFLP